jgi:hypothetical protein
MGRKCEAAVSKYVALEQIGVLIVYKGLRVRDDGQKQQPNYHGSQKE